MACSSLLTACVRGQQVERALHWYDHMSKARIEADTITYSVLLPACLDQSIPLPRVLGLMEEMHAAGHSASPDTYARIMQSLGSKACHPHRSLKTFPVQGASLIL